MSTDMCKYSHTYTALGDALAMLRSIYMCPLAEKTTQIQSGLELEDVCVVHRSKMMFTLPSLLVLATAAVTNGIPHRPPQQSTASCRFALDWSQEDVVRNTDAFINDMLYWEGRFHQNNVSYNTQNGMSYDGTQLDWTTGERTAKHTFSAASKEVRPATMRGMLPASDLAQ